jgi:hypothetical protein
VSPWGFFLRKLAEGDLVSVANSPKATLFGQRS